MFLGYLSEVGVNSLLNWASHKKPDSPVKLEIRPSRMWDGRQLAVRAIIQHLPRSQGGYVVAVFAPRP